MLDPVSSALDIVDNSPQTVEEMEKIIAFAEELLRQAGERIILLRSAGKSNSV